jgi:hypothetical protein
MFSQIFGYTVDSIKEDCDDAAKCHFSMFLSCSLYQHHTDLLELLSTVSDSYLDPQDVTDELNIYANRPYNWKRPNM